MTYRRRKTSDTWHYVKTCRWWPASNYNVHPKQSRKKPTYGEFCNECRRRAKRGEK